MFSNVTPSNRSQHPDMQNQEDDEKPKQRQMYIQYTNEDIAKIRWTDPKLLFEEMTQEDEQAKTTNPEQKSAWGLIYRHIKVPPQFQKLKEIIDRSKEESESQTQQLQSKLYEEYFNKKLEALKLRKEREMSLDNSNTQVQGNSLDAKQFFQKQSQLNSLQMIFKHFSPDRYNDMDVSDRQASIKKKEIQIQKLKEIKEKEHKQQPFKVDNRWKKDPLKQIDPINFLRSNQHSIQSRNHDITVIENSADCSVVQTYRTYKTQDSVGIVEIDQLDCLSRSLSQSRESVEKENRSRSKNRGTVNSSPMAKLVAAAPRMIPEVESKNNLIELINAAMFIIQQSNQKLIMPTPEVKGENDNNDIKKKSAIDVFSVPFDTTQRSIDLGNDPSIMYCSPEKPRHNKTAQTRYRKQSKKQKLDDNRTKCLQNILRQLFYIKDDQINGTFNPNCYGFDLQKLSFYFEKTEEEDFDQLFKQIEPILKVLNKYYDTIMRNDKSFINVIHHKVLEFLKEIRESGQRDTIMSERCSTALQMPMISRARQSRKPIVCVNKRQTQKQLQNFIQAHQGNKIISPRYAQALSPAVRQSRQSKLQSLSGLNHQKVPKLQMYDLQVKKELHNGRGAKVQIWSPQNLSLVQAFASNDASLALSPRCGRSFRSAARGLNNTSNTSHGARIGVSTSYGNKRMKPVSIQISQNDRMNTQTFCSTEGNKLQNMKINKTAKSRDCYQRGTEARKAILQLKGQYKQIQQ